jgi:hypothetical protein
VSGSGHLRHSQVLSVHTPHMFVLAVVGALVLAMVSWAALREAQRLPRSFPAERRAKAGAARAATVGDVATSEARPASVAPVNGRPVLASPRAQVDGDPTIAAADTDEALAAAAALWHVLVDDERH